MLLKSYNIFFLNLVLSLQNTPQMLDKVNRQFDKSTKQHFEVTGNN